MKTEQSCRRGEGPGLARLLLLAAYVLVSLLAASFHTHTEVPE